MKVLTQVTVTKTVMNTLLLAVVGRDRQKILSEMQEHFSNKIFNHKK